MSLVFLGMLLPAAVVLGTLPPASRLLIDLQLGTPPGHSTPTLAASPTPHFGFVPEALDVAPPRGAVMTAYRLIVTDAASGAVAWDSGMVAATSAVAVQCATPLRAPGSFVLSAQYWTDAAGPSPASSAAFDIGPPASAWERTPWLGGVGQRELRFNAAPNATRLYLASPGGVVVRAGASAVGDAAGISAWRDYDVRVMYEARVLTDTASPLVLQLGGGFYAKPVGPAPSPAVKALVCDAAGACEGVGGATLPAEGRAGPVVSDSVKLGTHIDWRVASSEGWAAAATLGAAEAPRGALAPLSTPAATTRGAVMPTGVEAIGDGAWHYTLPANIVGHVEIAAAAWTGPGNLTVQHCERLVAGASPPRCVVLSGLAPGVIDTHTLPAGAGVAHGTTPLAPRFTWHGFQHVLVVASGGAAFSGALDALTARWTTADLERTSALAFSADGGGATLAALHEIVVSSQLANMAAYVPTDCPTREKHGWLGDGLATAEEAAYNLWAPTVHQQFLEMIRDEQVPAGKYAGFVPSVVPGPVQEPGDLSWTAAYPLLARWLLRYHGAAHTVREHWPALTAWADGVAAAAAAAGKTLPDFYVWGDWCAVEARASCTPGTGPQAAAANWVLAIQAMGEMATAIGETADATKYAAHLADVQAAYDQAYWDASAGGHVGGRPALEHQTLASISLAALAGAAAPGAGGRRNRTAALLADDVAGRAHHLTVGSVGQKWLLRTLSAGGAHDAALRLATQRTFPSWGHWLELNATTCWESWSGEADPSHPPPPTHNHIFLCGGLGEWLHREMGGIAPAADGYAQVRIAPHISPTLGPAAVNASVLTVRGRVESRWVRGAAGAVRLAVRVPTGVQADVLVPRLGARCVELREGSGALLWPAGGSGGAEGADKVKEEGDALRVRVGAGAYDFELDPCEEVEVEGGAVRDGRVAQQ